jgi:hypothetical protein
MKTINREFTPPSYSLTQTSLHDPRTEAACKKKQVFGDLRNEEVPRGMKLVEPAYRISSHTKKIINPKQLS